MNVRTAAFVTMVCAICSGLSSQEHEDSRDPVFFINSFTYNVKGNTSSGKGYTRPDALNRIAEFEKGMELTGKAELEAYIREKTQILFNERFLESVNIDYTAGEMREDGKIPVDLFINVKDTWNIIAIPRPQYSSNSGWDITIKARDYNFLGTMQPLRLDIGYRYDEQGRTFLNFMLDSDMPFSAFNLDWNFNFDNYFDYRPNMAEPYYYRNETGLSADLPIGQTTLTLGFSESFFVNEENSDSRKIQYQNLFSTELGDFQNGLYMSSKPYLSWKIPTGIVIGYLGDLVYTPNVSATFNHEFPQWRLDETRKGPFLSFGHSLGFGRIDWIGNFLNGIDLRISNSYGYNFFNAREELEPWSASLRITAIGHKTFDDMFGISARLQYRQWFFENYHESAGDVLRGVRDKDVSADYMVSLNLDLSMKLIKFRPSGWLDNQKLRIFNFDLHIVPILDAAIYRNPEREAELSGTDFTYKNMLISTGMEAIIFPEFFRSLFLRISLGINLSTLNGMAGYELFIGTDLHY